MIFVKKKTALFLTLICILSMSGCSGNKEVRVINTFEQTPADLTNAYLDQSKVLTLTTYYELSDGTWKTDDHAYKYRLEISGRLNNAVKDSTYVILSNTDDITFEQAWKASGLSSNMDDYFNIEDAVIVGIG